MTSGLGGPSQLRRAEHPLFQVLVRVPLASDQVFLLFVEPLAPTAQSRVGRC